MTRAVAAVAALLLVTGAACGSDGGSSSSAPTPAIFNSPCGPAKPAADNLPKIASTFPHPDPVTYFGGSKAGPSTILYAYYAADLTEAHKGWADALKGAGYTITAEEQDPADAEVNFSGHGTTGQVRLNESCKGRSIVTVTIRPG